MSSARTRSLAAKLTMWYCGIFACSTLVAYAVVWLAMNSLLQNSIRDEVAEDLAELSLLYADSGLQALWDEVVVEIASEGADQVFFRLLDNEGGDLRSTSLREWPQSVLTGGDLAANNAGQPVIAILQDASLDFDVAVGSIDLDSNTRLQIGMSLESATGFLDVLRNIFLLSLPVMLLLAAVFGWLLARKALSGLELVGSTARAISKGQFEERVPHLDHGREINDLADTFNDMLDKIQLLIRGMREITDNIAHDLRSPLTSIRGQAEALLTSSAPADLESCQQVLAHTIEESDRLIGMINTMMDITETEAGLMTDKGSEVDISSLVQEACDLFMPVAAEQHVSLEFHTQDNLRVRGNASFLQRLVANLVDNALKYTKAGGRVRVKLQKLKDQIQLQIDDTGIGIDPGDMDKIFSRFFRCDNSRSLPGNGLGLSLARAIVKAHCGEISVHSKLNEGTSFTVTLPQA